MVSVPLSVPQAGEHEVFATDKFQLTPWLPEVPETVALTVTGAPPIAMVAKLPLTLTTIPEGEVEADEEPHPAHQKKIERHSSAERERFIDPSERPDFRSVDFAIQK